MGHCRSLCGSCHTEQSAIISSQAIVQGDDEWTHVRWPGGQTGTGEAAEHGGIYSWGGGSVKHAGLGRQWRWIQRVEVKQILRVRIQNLKVRDEILGFSSSTNQAWFGKLCVCVERKRGGTHWLKWIGHWSFWFAVWMIIELSQKGVWMALFVLCGETFDLSSTCWTEKMVYYKKKSWPGCQLSIPANSSSDDSQ